MEKEDCFHHLLNKVGPVVPPSEMCDLMNQHLPQFGRRKFVDCPSRNHNRWIQKPDCGWNAHLLRRAQSDRPLLRLRVKDPLDRRIQNIYVDWRAALFKSADVPES